MIKRINVESPAGGAGVASSGSGNGFSTESRGSIISRFPSPAFGSSASSPISIGGHPIIKSYDSETGTTSNYEPSSFRIGLNGTPLEMNDKQLLTAGNRIPGGRFSDVYKVKSTPSNVTYIIKHIKPEQYFPDATLREFNNLIQFKGNNQVIQLIAANIYDHEAYFVHEYIPGKTLHDWLETGPTNDERINIIGQLKSAVTSIHDAKYVHLDLHPKNIWIPEDSSKPLFLLDLGSMYRIGETRNSVTRTEGYSPGAFSPINITKATVAINDFAMNKLKSKIMPRTAGGNRKTRMKRQKRKRYTKKGNRK
jgi:hypothetical protein